MLCIRLQVVLSYASWDADSFRVLRPQCQSNKRTLEEFTKRPLYPVLPTDCVSSWTPSLSLNQTRHISSAIGKSRKVNYVGWASVSYNGGNQSSATRFEVVSHAPCFATCTQGNGRSRRHSSTQGTLPQHGVAVLYPLLHRRLLAGRWVRVGVQVHCPPGLRRTPDNEVLTRGGP